MKTKNIIIDPPKPCKVVNEFGHNYIAVPCPEFKCNTALSLDPYGEGTIFPSRTRARHAISHTIEMANKYGSGMNVNLRIVPL